MIVVDVIFQAGDCLFVSGQTEYRGDRLPTAPDAPTDKSVLRASAYISYVPRPDVDLMYC